MSREHGTVPARPLCLITMLSLCMWNCEAVKPATIGKHNIRLPTATGLDLNASDCIIYAWIEGRTIDISECILHLTDEFKLLKCVYWFSEQRWRTGLFDSFRVQLRHIGFLSAETYILDRPRSTRTKFSPNKCVSPSYY